MVLSCSTDISITLPQLNTIHRINSTATPEGSHAAKHCKVCAEQHCNTILVWTDLKWFLTWQSDSTMLHATCLACLEDAEKSTRLSQVLPPRRRLSGDFFTPAFHFLAYFSIRYLPRMSSVVFFSGELSCAEGVPARWQSNGYEMITILFVINAPEAYNFIQSRCLLQVNSESNICIFLVQNNTSDEYLGEE